MSDFQAGDALAGAISTASPQQLASMQRILTAMQRGEPCNVTLPCRRCARDFTVSAYVRGAEADYCRECCEAIGRRESQSGRRNLNRPAPPFEFADAELRLTSDIDATLKLWVDGVGLVRLPEEDESQRPWCLVCSGPPGSGKTWSTWAMIAELMKNPADLRGGTIEHTTAYDLVAEIRGHWREHRYNSGVSDKETRYTNDCALLILDDLSSDKLQKDGARELFPVLDRRWACGLMTVLTTNDDRESFYDLVGPSLASRVIGSGRWVEFPPIDRRVRKA